MTTQETRPIEPHTVHSRRLIEHAEEELAKGDRLQASEKAWGAVAHQLKVVADYRGLKYTSHVQAIKMVERLAKETEDPRDLRMLFRNAELLHANYYIDSRPLEEIADQINEIKTLLEILNRPEFVGPVN